MAKFNSTSYSPSEFILIGFPGLEYAHTWIAIPLCFMYVFALFGNCTILYVIKTERSLHEPMYLFLAMLAAIDILLYTMTMPKTLLILWFDLVEISFSGCSIQMFFIHCLSTMETTVLVAMAFGRYIAICYPLQHSSILTNQRITYIGLISVIRATTFCAPLPFLIKRLPFCGSRVLSHSFCVHQDMMKLACANTTPNVVYGLTAILFINGIDSLLISFSYAMILKTVCGLSKKERMKAFNTCVSHIAVVFIFYIPLLGLSVVHRFGDRSSLTMHIVMGDVYLFVPPVLNPIVYGIKTNKIRAKIFRCFQHTF